jgi:hypothetical protein
LIKNNNPDFLKVGTQAARTQATTDSVPLQKDEEFDMNNFSKTVTALTLAIAASSSFAGTLGDTSTETSTVTLEVTDKVQISNISDIAPGACNGTDANLNGGTSHGVFRNGADDYRLKLNTDQAGGFEVKSATTGDTIDFTAKIDDDNNAADVTDILHDAHSGNMAGSALTICGGANNGALYVNFTQTDLLAVSSESDHQAVTTVLVEPT